MATAKVPPLRHLIISSPTFPSVCWPKAIVQIPPITLRCLLAPRVRSRLVSTGSHLRFADFCSAHFILPRRPGFAPKHMGLGLGLGLTSQSPMIKYQ